MFREESITSLDELHNQLLKEQVSKTLPSHFILHKNNDEEGQIMNVSLLKVEYSDTKGHQITCSVLFEKDLTYKLFFNGVLVENKVVSKVTKRHKYKQ